MSRFQVRVLLVPLALLPGAGCMSDDGPTELVRAGAIGRQVPTPKLPTKAAYAPPSLEVATRVDSLGRKIVAANPQVGLRPYFTAGSDPRPEIFHKGTGEVVVTTGLVERCKTDAELAAVLCLELGKMVSEREALATPQPKRLRPPPMELRIGNDNAGIVGPSDDMAMIERAKFEKDDRKRNAGLPLPPDPHALARGFLARAGYKPEDLNTVAPLLREAEKNSSWEKMMKANPQQQDWH